MKGKTRIKRLIPRLPELYKAHKRLEKRLGAPPSIREVAEELGLGDNYVSRIHGDMEILTALGLARRLPIPTRKFQCVGPPADEINWEGLLSD